MAPDPCFTKRSLQTGAKLWTNCFYFVMKQRTCARILINLVLSPSRKLGSGKSVNLTKQCGVK